jgi:hypothetical protein
MVVVTSSSSGKLLTLAKVKLEAPGYVVIHEGKLGSLGAILGYSKLLEAGDYMDVVVGLGREVSDGEALYAALYLDDWDGQFNPKADKVATDRQGNPVMTKFIVGTEVEGASQAFY